jgi:DNA sulfur modification protein DndC
MEPKMSDRVDTTLKFGGEHLEEIYQEIERLYFSNNYPWIVAYSGGKDSTATLQLIWNAIERIPREKLNKPIYVLSSDTLVEIPKVINYVEKNIELINKAAEKKKLPIKAVKVRPKVSDTFWVNLIGRGYPAPTKDFRWCTDRLKIEPLNRFVLETVNRFGEVVVVLGVRKDESINRERVINEHKIGTSKLAKHSTLPGALVFSPIENWKVEDVWNYLLSYESPWGGSNLELFEMYKKANADDPPVVLGSFGKVGAKSGGNSRFGCWVCTVVKKEKSLSSLIESGERWLLPLQRFRELLVKTQNPDEKHKYRDYKRRDGSVYFVKSSSGNGIKRLGRGPYKFEFRKVLLRKLLEAEKEINQNNPYNKEISLITYEELLEIRKIWKLEEGDWEDSVSKIYKEVYGQEFHLPQEDEGIFSSEDKEIISELAEQVGVNSKLVIKLLNLSQYNMSSFRKRKFVDEINRILNEEWRDEEEILKEVDKR